MKPSALDRTNSRPRLEAAGGQEGTNVFALDGARILRALKERRRYKYVRPRIIHDGWGWVVMSPNCSRSIDASGGEIPIARFQHAQDGSWEIEAYDHAAGRWVFKANCPRLSEALALVCEDPKREYWQ